jgi:hypothetical protein
MIPDALAEFRRVVSGQARRLPRQWEASRKLLEKSAFPSTMTQLHHLILEKELPAPVKDCLLRLFDQKELQQIQDLDGACLKALTGLTPAKAVRALSVFFELVPAPGSKWPMTRMASEEIERAVRTMVNPFDLLRRTDVASVLDIGAGDLSFAEELVGLYGPELTQQNRPFVLHCLDRLDPRSQLGGPLHVKPDTLQRLQQKQGLSFSFFGNQDMFELGSLDEQEVLAPRYTIATCWAPATPTFAYEPTRLTQALISAELERTKGTFRGTRFGKEPALEVQHGDRALLFPPWKFDIVGPLALLRLLASRGFLCVLGSVDAQVFWELLAQLLDDPRYRPRNELFTTDHLPKIFGKVYDVLAELPIGQSIDLADVAALRRGFSLPHTSHSPDGLAGMFRYVRISRGATFPGTPASRTARAFSSMIEEVPPWLVTLVPA